MSNAEERALEAYPVIMDSVSKGFNFSVEEDINYYPRKKFQEGYQAAEKDLELTWQDVWRIGELHEEVKNDFCDNPRMFDLKGDDITPENFKRAFSEEVLRRFKEERG